MRDRQEGRGDWVARVIYDELTMMDGLSIEDQFKQSDGSWVIECSGQLDLTALAGRVLNFFERHRFGGAATAEGG